MRPTLYDPAQAQAVLDKLEEGVSLNLICKAEGMPRRTTFLEWVASDRDGLSVKYTRARNAGYEVLAEEIMAIADATTQDTIKTDDGRDVPNHEWIARSRLRVDTRKWLLSKMLPKLYGDRTSVEHSGPEGAPIPVQFYIPSNGRDVAPAVPALDDETEE